MNNNLKYQQVYDDLLDKINTDHYLNNQKLPSEIKLAESFDVSRVTIRQALDRLNSEGFIERIKGKGTFVKKKPLEKKIGKIISFTESTLMLGNTPSSNCIQIEKIKSPLSVQNYLNVSEEEEVWSIKRNRFVNSLVVLYEESYWVASLCGDLDKAIAEKSIITHLKSKNIYLGYGKQEFIALSADKDLAFLLNVNIGFPLLKSTMSFFTMAGAPIFLAINYYRTDRVTITSNRVIDD